MRRRTPTLQARLDDVKRMADDSRQGASGDAGQELDSGRRATASVLSLLHVGNVEEPSYILVWLIGVGDQVGRVGGCGWWRGRLEMSQLFGR